MVQHWAQKQIHTDYSGKLIFNKAPEQFYYKEKSFPQMVLEQVDNCIKNKNKKHLNSSTT